jgi:hypothetical protein
MSDTPVTPGSSEGGRGRGRGRGGRGRGRSSTEPRGRGSGRGGRTGGDEGGGDEPTVVTVDQGQGSPTKQQGQGSPTKQQGQGSPTKQQGQGSPTKQQGQGSSPTKHPSAAAVAGTTDEANPNVPPTLEPSQEKLTTAGEASTSTAAAGPEAKKPVVEEACLCAVSET